MNVEDIISKYYAKESKLYNIYISHVSDVTEKALWVAQKHPELAIDIKFIEQAGMLHDIGIYLTDAPRIACYGDMPYICHGYLGRNMLTKEGYPKHGLVCERHTGTGLSLQNIIDKKLPIPQRDMRPQSLEEQIICFADKFYSKSKLGQKKSIKKIRYNLKRHDTHQVEIFDRWCEMFL